jgi:Protein of unknown function (DUF1569)
MKHLFEPATLEEVIARIDRLNATSQRQWGKMDAAQMMAHCSNALEMACGDRVAKRSLIGRLVGGRVRHLLTNDKPFPKNSPTDKQLKISDPREFAREQERLKQCVRKFQTGGEAKCTSQPHPFFGPITPMEWSSGMYKHLDHHLRQFGA